MMSIVEWVKVMVGLGAEPPSLQLEVTTSCELDVIFSNITDVAELTITLIGSLEDTLEMAEDGQVVKVVGAVQCSVVITGHGDWLLLRGAGGGGGVGRV
jgi:hypothetical protein